MGGGHSDPKSVQNDGITLKGNYSGNAVTTYKNLTTGGDGNTQKASSTGATVGVKAGVTVVPALMQLQALQNLNLWDSIKHGAETLGDDAVKAVEHCAKDVACRTKAEQGAQAIYDHYAHKNPQTLQELNFNHWLHNTAHTLENDAKKVGEESWKGATWCM